ncbi:MAG TPA: PIN domain-containing protein [Candidatus Limnocylindrales bacterium]|nr:PIN domain-containing protein [Candidatus Limnocylindrales bacterium]
MIGVDTSVVVRYLVGSPPEQAARARTLFESDAEIGVSLIALVETAHVLRSQYGVARAAIVDALVDLLTRTNVAALGYATQDVIDSLVIARSLPGTPIADSFIVLAASAAGAVPIYSFDAGLGRHGTPVEAP